MNTIKNAVILLKAISDETRINIIKCIYDNDISVKNIASNIKMSQSAISHQLKTLKEANIVICKRCGKEMIYSLADEHIKTIIEQVFTHLECGA